MFGDTSPFEENGTDPFKEYLPANIEKICCWNCYKVIIKTSAITAPNIPNKVLLL